MSAPLHVFLFAVALWSGYAPLDRLTWYLEVLPGFLGWGMFYWFHKKFSLPFWMQFVFAAHITLLFVGGHYTYAEVPGFDFHWPILGGERNQFDKLGHFFQGISPALITYECARRIRMIQGEGWRMFFSVSTALGFSALYELVEWLVSVCLESEGDAFLGTQGYIWDTQSDMLMALLGAMASMICIRIFRAAKN